GQCFAYSLGIRTFSLETGLHLRACMPVTAKLSRKFYETFGDDIANELVEWFNAVDATYRSDLRELNELNFARFDAKLEQRIAELRAELQTEMRAGFAQADARMLAGFARVDQRVAEFEARLTKRMLNFWIAQAATTVALVLGVVKLVKG